ncbi:carbon-nitrogen hydrolase family protein [Campylobacter corcagiensis]|uniref:Carbon-nitrogen hydrolase family protein n=1 Tax=Campylobacter corcagiensis TaxID=1448857 RepID=A0A7M1LHE9_9BACT|nr:carbon-nitrogen hydrolase family protein [Campylobacter corcagiensis]QKF64336.1 carbon-nitrogen hydrolase family protein [Campylobacter corcagiensis]QOQ87474.1 carbon-nitrogen hydrolase family protein [Campylobacter corcagiensis]
MSKVAILQLPTLSMSEGRIDYYIRAVVDSGASLALIGEYVLNSFFSELIKMPKAMINEQISHKLELFKDIAKRYEIDIVAPFIIEKAGGYYKVIAKFSPKSVRFVEQNFLMNYSHWDEKSFFKNKFEKAKFLCFNHNGFKIGVMAGFETHFDISWKYMRDAKVDAVLVPTASTFESNLRWEKLLSMRAFTNLVYVLRANRVGKVKISNNQSWEFYGDSFAVSPNGKISSRLSFEEGVLLFELSKKEIKDERKLWKFTEILKGIDE